MFSKNAAFESSQYCNQGNNKLVPWNNLYIQMGDLSPCFLKNSPEAWNSSIQNGKKLKIIKHQKAEEKYSDAESLWRDLSPFKMEALSENLLYDKNLGEINDTRTLHLSSASIPYKGVREVSCKQEYYFEAEDPFEDIDLDSEINEILFPTIEA